MCGFVAPPRRYRPRRSRPRHRHHLSAIPGSSSARDVTWRPSKSRRSMKRSSKPGREWATRTVDVGRGLRRYYSACTYLREHTACSRARARARKREATTLTRDSADSRAFFTPEGSLTRRRWRELLLKRGLSRRSNDPHSHPRDHGYIRARTLYPLHRYPLHACPVFSPRSREILHRFGAMPRS